MIDDPLEFLDEAKVARFADAVRSDVLEAARGGRLAIVGSARLPQKCADALRTVAGPPACFIEYDARYWGTNVGDIPVIGPASARARLPGDAVIVSGVWSPNHSYRTTSAWLHSFGFGRVLPAAAVFWAMGESLPPHYQLAPPHALAQNRQRVRAVYDALYDEESRVQFRDHLRWRVTLDPDFIPDADREHRYFDPSLFRLDDGANVVDCGAYDGDSLKAFLKWRGEDFGHFHAYEPDPITFGQLQRYLSELPESVRNRISPWQMAVGENPGLIYVTPTGALGSQTTSTKGDIEVPIVRLDEHLGGDRVDYLKLDIEGAEWDALAGVWSTVEKSRPVIATAIYHQPDDIFALPEYIIARTPGYSYLVRSHDDDGIDLVFYAVPKEKGVPGQQAYRA